MPADNGSADPQADVRPFRPANTILGAIRGLMATGAAARDDQTGLLVATLGAGNVYSVNTNEGQLAPATQIPGPFLLRLSFDTTLAGASGASASGTTAAVTGVVPHLKIDGVDCGPMVRRNGSALADGDLVAGPPVLLLGEMAAPTDTTVTRVRVLDITASDLRAMANAVSFRNRLVNPTFSLNSRGVAQGSTDYVAGARIMDCWRAGANGCTLSFAPQGNGGVAVAILSGSLCQTIEGALYLPEGGAYVLSWVGTAQGRAYQGSNPPAYGAAPVAVAGLTAGTNTTVEFGVGTLALAQFEVGASPSAFERRDDEERRARRYVRRVGQSIAILAASATTIDFHYLLDQPMRAAPTATALSMSVLASRAGGNVQLNFAGPFDTSAGPQGGRFAAYLTSGSLTQGEVMFSMQDDVFLLSAEF